MKNAKNGNRLRILQKLGEKATLEMKKKISFKTCYYKTQQIIKGYFGRRIRGK